MNLADFRRDPGGALVACLDRSGARDEGDEAPSVPALASGEAWAPETSLAGVPANVQKNEREFA